MENAAKEKVKQKLPLEEQETTITWDRSNPTAEIYTHDPKLKRIIRMFAEQFPDVFFIVDDDEVWGSISAKFPCTLVSIRKPRELSEETRERLREHGSRLSKRKRLEEEIEDSSLQQAFI